MADEERFVERISSDILRRIRALRNIEWIYKKTGKLSAWRNTIVHLPLDVMPVEKKLIPFPLIAARPISVHRFNSIAGDGFWHALIGDLYVLSVYAEHVGLDLIQPAENFPKIFSRLPLPRRPRLLSIPKIQEIERKMNLNPTPKKRKRRHVSSRP